MNLNKDYLYCIDLRDDITCNNFSIPGPLQSTLCANSFMFSSPLNTRLYNVDPNLLYTNPFMCFGGVGSPCSKTILLAWSIRNGQKIMTCLGREYKITEEQKAKYVSKANIEIEFEKIRQTHFQGKPSRITSFFLADDDPDGLITMQNVFGDRVARALFDPFIMHTKVTYLILQHKADIRWMDEYAQSNNPKCILNYWEGKPFDKFDRWEYIVEGQIYPSRKNEIAELRRLGTFLEHSQDHWIDLDLLEQKGRMA